MISRVADPMLDRVKALLAKAEASNFPEEREAFNRKATALIAKYGITAAMLADDGQLADMVGDRVIVLSDPYARQKAQLLVDIADPLRVKVILNVDVSRGMAGFQAHMFGFASDIDRVDLLLASLLVQSARGLATARPAADRTLTASQLKAFRRDWLAGFGVKVRTRLRAAEMRAAREHDAASAEHISSGGRSTALVLADRSHLVEQAIAEAYPPGRLRDGGRRPMVNADAFVSGFSAGASVDLSNTASITPKNN